MIYSKTFCSTVNSDGTHGILLGISPARYPIGEMFFFISEENENIRIDHLGDGVSWIDNGILTVKKNGEALTFRPVNDPLTDKLSTAADRISGLLEDKRTCKEIDTAASLSEKERVYNRQQEIQKKLGLIAEDGTFLIERSERKIFRGDNGFRVATKEEIRYREQQEKEHPELIRESIRLMLRMEELRGRKSVKEKAGKEEK